MPLILGANSVSGGYEIDNSLRFNSGSSDYLSRTYGTATNNLKYTKSFWIKRSGLSDIVKGFVWCSTSNSNTDYFYFNASDQILVGNTSTPYTTAVFRDVSAWYHCVMVFDSANATAANRLILYINNVQQTLSATITQNSTGGNESGETYTIGYQGGAGRYLDAYMAEVYMIDGQALTPSSFGASNASGVWYPIPYAGSYGTNGFNLKFTNASSLGTDSSPNGNNFTVNNLTSVDQSTDSTLNNFATLNPLVPQNDNLTFTNGNLQAVKSSGSATGSFYGTFGVSAGKWYWEMKCNAVGGNDQWIGIGQMRTLAPSGYPGNDAYTVAAGSGGEVRYNGTTVSSYTMASWTAGDIIMVALDMTNSRVYWGKNGTWQDSGDPDNGTNPYTNSTIFDGNFIFPVGSLYQSGGDVAYNFGSPIYSANSYTDGAGYGNFSYAVPSGYYALCTANLNTYG